ncbi:MAG: Ldh family oxidoreductase [Dehalococcoidia bacterium]
MLLTRDEELRFLIACLTAVGARSEVAEAAAEQMTEADLRGHGSHGLIRLGMLVDGVEVGVANPDPVIRRLRDRPTGALLDGDRGFGSYVGREAMRLAIGKARESGVSLVGARNVHYSGFLAYFGEMAAREGFAAIVASATPAIVHAWGGRSKVLGTTPLCISLPGREHPLTLDIATSEAARGKILRAAKQGETIPEGWALDAAGNPTTDPKEALAGAQSPFGGHKGSGLAFMLSLLTGPLLGVPADVALIPPTRGGTTSRGDFFFVFDPEMFGPLAGFVEGAEWFAEEIRRSPPAAGHDAVRLPGDRSHQTRSERLITGIPIDDSVWNDACTIAGRVGVTDDIPK